jgi:endonuclease YncB( thermonuclease family)
MWSGWGSFPSECTCETPMDCYQLVSLAALLLFASPALAAPPATETRLTLKVVSVHDGDTFAGINEVNEKVKVRLDAVDASEPSQPYRHASRKVEAAACSLKKGAMNRCDANQPWDEKVKG